VSCVNGTGGTALASKGDPEGMVLSRTRSSLHWASAVRGSLLMLLAGLSLSSTHVGSSLVSKRFPPGSYTNLPLSLVPKSLALRGWLLQLRSLLLPSSMMPRSLHVGLPWMLLPLLSVLLSSPCAVLHLMSLSGVVWSFWGTCACSGFIIGVASLFLILEISACSCIWQLFGFASVASDWFGDAAAIDKGGGGRGS